MELKGYHSSYTDYPKSMHSTITPQKYCLIRIDPIFAPFRAHNKKTPRSAGFGKLYHVTRVSWSVSSISFTVKKWIIQSEKKHQLYNQLLADFLTVYVAKLHFDYSIDHDEEQYQT